MSNRAHLPPDAQAALGSLDTILVLTRLIDIEPIKDALAALGRFDNIGHILDPTAYIAGADARKYDGRILHAFLKFRGELDAVKAEIDAKVAADATVMERFFTGHES